jgi:hypothetical protein
MKIEDIVCDIEYAENLKVLGLKRKDTLFAYLKGEIQHECCDCACGYYDCKTYTVADLGEMLPLTINDNDTMGGISYLGNFFYEPKYKFSVSYGTDYDGMEGSCFNDKKEANARAKLLIWLIENNHVNVEELNK